MINIHGLTRKNSFDLIFRILPLFLLLISLCYLLILLPNSLVKDVQAVSETRYMRSDTQSVNSLTAYKLDTTQSSSSLSTAITETGSGSGTSYWGIRVWKRNSSGTETEITSGTPVAQVSRTSAGSGLQSATWAPTEASIAATDSIVVRVYLQINSGGWQQGGTAPIFTTGQLGNTLLEGNTWTVYYYTQDERRTSGPPSGRYLTATYHWGNSTYNSRIEDFTHSSGSTVITVGTTGSQRATVEPSTSDIHMGGAFTFTRSASSTNVTSITISETGTISDSNISGLILYYKQESSCSATIPVDATQFNSTAGTFSSGSSTVTGSMTVGTSQICVYVEMDIGSGAQNNETIEIQITTPSTQVSVSSGTVTPSTAVAISGATTIDSNQGPSFTDFSNDGPKEPGQNITFTATSTDPNDDSVSLAVCKTTGTTTNTEWDLNYPVYSTYFVQPISATRSMFFDSTGTTLIIHGWIYDRNLYKYTLSTPWDISTASYDSITYEFPQQQDSDPEYIYLNTTGTTLYMLGNSSDSVYQYTLSTAWDISTASYASKSTSIGTQEANPTSIYITSDGTKMYIVGLNDTVYQYTLSTAWDISTASYASKSFSISTQENYPSSIYFSSDGTKMYAVGTTNSTVYQYSLSTAWDISTASYANKSFSVSSRDDVPRGIFWESSGKALYVLGDSTKRIIQFNLPTISCDGGISDTYCWTYQHASNPSCKYTIPIPTPDTSYSAYPYVFDEFEEPSTSNLQGASSSHTVGNSPPIISTVTINDGAAITLTEGTTKSVSLTGTVTDYNSCYNSEISSVSASVYSSGIGTITGNKSKNISTYDFVPTSIIFNSDGTKMYNMGTNSDSVDQYSLSTAWDISTLSYDSKTYTVTTQDLIPYGLFLSSDGTKMYIAGHDTVSIYQYTLSTAWDVSTASYANKSYSISEDLYIYGLTFSSDGTKMYVTGSQYDSIYQYTLSTAWDVSTASYANKYLYLIAQNTFPRQPYFNSDGTKLYIIDYSTATIYQYTLSTGWDLSTASYFSKFLTIYANESTPCGLSFSSDGTKMYVVGPSSDTVYQYFLSTAWDVITASYFGNAYSYCDTSGEANNNNCYPEISCSYVTDSCTGVTDASANYTCTAYLQPYADPTDTGTPYTGQYWIDTLKATDNNSAVGSTEILTGVTLNSLISFNIDSSIFYGNLGAGSSNDPLDVTTTTTPTGNTGLNHEVYGPANMCTDFPTCSGSTIGIANQRYATASSTAFSSATVLTTSAVPVTMNILKPINATPASKNLWWGIYVPTDADAGTYYGNITVTGIKSNASNWYE